MIASEQFYIVTQSVAAPPGYRGIVEGDLVTFPEKYFTHSVEYPVLTLIPKGTTLCPLFPYYRSKPLSSFVRPATQEEVDKVFASMAMEDIAECVPRWNKVKSNHYIGSDPEVFAVDEKGEVIPAWKYLPHKSTGTGVYWDGFQGEFTTCAGGCIAYFVDNVHNQLSKVYSHLHNTFPSATLTGECVLPIPKALMDEATDEHTALGCLPSMNVYGDTGEGVGEGRELPIRFAGCHLHYGLPSSLHKYTPTLIKALDKVVGVTSVAVLQGLENPLRRGYYGLAGEYRTPPHGLEYRVLSSAILWHPALYHFFMGLFRLTINMELEGFIEKLWKASEEETRQAINALDVSLAQEILTRNQDLLKTMIYGTWLAPSTVYPLSTETKEMPSIDTVWEEFVMKGVKRKMTEDLPKNWKLHSSSTWEFHSEGKDVMFWRFLKSHYMERDR